MITSDDPQLPNVQRHEHIRLYIQILKFNCFTFDGMTAATQRKSESKVQEFSVCDMRCYSQLLLVFLNTCAANILAQCSSSENKEASIVH